MVKAEVLAVFLAIFLGFLTTAQAQSPVYHGAGQSGGVTWLYKEATQLDRVVDKQSRFYFFTLSEAENRTHNKALQLGFRSEGRANGALILQYKIRFK